MIRRTLNYLPTSSSSESLSSKQATQHFHSSKGALHLSQLILFGQFCQCWSIFLKSSQNPNSQLPWHFGRCRIISFAVSQSEYWQAVQVFLFRRRDFCSSKQLVACTSFSIISSWRESVFPSPDIFANTLVSRKKTKYTLSKIIWFYWHSCNAWCVMLVWCSRVSSLQDRLVNCLTSRALLNDFEVWGSIYTLLVLFKHALNYHLLIVIN